MIQQALTIAYYIVLFFAVLSGLFITYHLIKYSYNKAALLLMLIIFCGVLGLLLVLNLSLFSSIHIQDISSIFNL